MIAFYPPKLCIKGTITFSNADSFKGWFSDDLNTREGELTQWSRSGHKTSGKWINGRLEGLMRTENDYGGYEEAYYREGIRHGPSREFGPCPMRSDNLWHVYVYNCGKITGHTHISRISSHG